MNIKKKVYIKPNTMLAFNNSNNSDIRSPSITGTDNNYNSLPVDDSCKSRKKHNNMNSDDNDKDDTGKKGNILYNTLSPSLLSPISNNSVQNKKQIFYKKNIAPYTKIINLNNSNNNINNKSNKKKEEKNNRYELGDRAVTPIQKIRHIKELIRIANDNDNDNKDEEEKNNQIKKKRKK